MKKLVTVTFLVVLFLSSSAAILRAQNDPASIDVYKINSTITVDGVLDEAVWSENWQRIMFRVNGTGSGMNFSPTNAGLIVKGDYRDSSTTYVRFVVSGMDLFVSLQSNDQQVCKFDWEGDGLFMVFKNAANANCELKLYVINGTTFGAEGGGQTPVDGYAGVGVVSGTIFDSSDVDNGYTAEGVIHLDKLGFTTVPNTLSVSLVLFDPDHYSVAGSPWGTNGNFAKQWWGSEWGSDFRTLNIIDQIVPVELSSFTAVSSRDGVKLLWSTASEKNNMGFDVERSTDNKSFEKVGFVSGNGTTANRINYTYTDKSAEGNVFYRLKQMDFDGTYSYSTVVEINASVIEKYELSQNYPNPFNPSTTIKYAVPQQNFVTIKVFDILGNELKTLVNDQVEAGQHEVNFDAAGFSSGVYYYTITAGNFTDSKKFILMK